MSSSPWKHMLQCILLVLKMPRRDSWLFFYREQMHCKGNHSWNISLWRRGAGLPLTSNFYTKSTIYRGLVGCLPILSPSVGGKHTAAFAKHCVPSKCSSEPLSSQISHTNRNVAGGVVFNRALLLTDISVATVVPAPPGWAGILSNNFPLPHFLPNRLCEYV